MLAFLKRQAVCLTGALLLGMIASGISRQALAGGGYFALGYGHLGKQMAGAVTAVAGDAFAGASNPAKLTTAGNRLELGLELLNPRRKIKRTNASGAASIYNLASTSRNPFYVVPDFAYSRQVNEDLALGVAVFANGGLNSEYTKTTGVAGSNSNPEACGDRPGNFLTGCGHVGFDLSQLIVAPTLAWELRPGHSLGISPLFAAQRFEAFGLQGFAAVSKYPDKLTNNSHEIAYGAGVRIGWYGEISDRLALGLAYSTKIYMQKFDRYRGLFAQGTFDIPANYSAGLAFTPTPDWLVSFDVQRIEYGEVKSIANGVLNSLVPGGPLMGTADGSGFAWSRNQTNYKLGLKYRASSQLTLRGGYEYGRRPNKDDIDAASIGVIVPSPVHRASIGLTWQSHSRGDFHVAYGRYFKSTYSGPSAIFPGATETVKPSGNLLHFSWTRGF